MKRAAAVRGPAEDEKENGRSESDVMNKEPPAKKTVVETAPNPEVVKLQEKLFQSDTKLQHMCKMDLKSQGMIEDLRARVKFLENLIDTKEGILENANKASGSVEEELKKKVNDLKEELEECQLQAAQQRAKDSAKVGDSTNQLQRERDISTALREKVEFLEREKNLKDLELNQYKKEAKKQAAEHSKMRYLDDRLKELTSKDDQRVGELKSQLEKERQRSAELMKKLAQVDSQLLVQHRSIAATLASGDVHHCEDEQNSTKAKGKLAKRAKKGKENTCKASLSVIGSADSNGVASKQDKSSSNFREIQENEYSTNVKSLIVTSRSSSDSSADVELLQSLRDSPRVRSVIVKERIQGLFTNQNIPRGAYIAELCGYVSLQSKCSDRVISPCPWMNDLTFLIEKDGEKLLIDARKMGNSARFVRRSCKPNAELKMIMSGSDLHVMIKAIDGVEIRKEVSIKFEDDWKTHPRPAQGCTCEGDKLKTCEIELFFNKARQTATQSSAPSDALICEICDDALKDKNSYLTHLQSQHLQLKRKCAADMQKGAPLACSRCRNRLWTYEGLERHLVMCHGLVTSDLLTKAQKKEDGGRCMLCAKLFAFKVLNHLVNDHQVKLCSAEIMYSCGLCIFQSQSYKKLEEHLSKKHPGGRGIGAPGTSGPPPPKSFSERRSSLGAASKDVQTTSKD